MAPAEANSISHQGQSVRGEGWGLLWTLSQAVPSAGPVSMATALPPGVWLISTGDTGSSERAPKA